jgi:hypothetical protein
VERRIGQPLETFATTQGGRDSGRFGHVEPQGTDDGPLGPPTEAQPEAARAGDKTRRRLALSSPVVIVAVVAFVAWGIPIIQGFHFGCHVLTGDKVRAVRLGFEMCRGENQSERNAAEAAQRESRESEERAHKATEERQSQETQAKTQQEEQMIEEERPAHEEAVTKLLSEAASLQEKAHHEELLAKADESEVKRLDADANRVDGEETPEGNDSNYTQGEKITSEAENVQSHGENHESAAATFKSEAESKENEAAQERSKE